MARILMAWELGAGYGHLAPLLTLARPLLRAGHQVSFVVRDVAGAEAVLGGSGIPWYPAPANFSPSGEVTLHSYSQILLSTAFNNADELRARLRAWQSLYGLFEPDLVICDHAPTALLAARGGPMRCIVTGNGFVVPPDTSPLPELRAWEPEQPAVLEAAEARALDTANAALRGLGLPAFTRLAEVYSSAAPALLTLKELDNYAELRRDADYWGVLPGPGGSAPRWPKAEGKRLFFYGQAYPALEEVLTELARGPHCALVYIPKLAPELRQRLAGPRIVFADALMDMEAVTSQCDAAVMTNGHGTTAAMLLAGKPVVLLPQHLEMLLIARCVEQAGAGLAAAALKKEGILAKIGRVLEPGFAVKAQALAMDYRAQGGLDPMRKFQALVARLLQET
jgi:UDP:flavonoid glycosyltransferase YjiC (YdhE family)